VRWARPWNGSPCSPAASALHFGCQAAAFQLLARVVQPAQRLHARDQLLALHRLGKEVVGTRLDAAHPALAVLQRRDQDHRDERRRLIALQLPADLESACPGHHDVEQHQVGGRRAEE
jgi:hypothetical protein